MLCPADDIYTALQAKARDATLALIEKERDGEQIDRAMLKNILGIFIEMGMGSMEIYQTDFETDLLAKTAAFYKRKAAAWIQARKLLHDSRHIVSCTNKLGQTLCTVLSMIISYKLKPAMSFKLDIALLNLERFGI